MPLSTMLAKTKTVYTDLKPRSIDIYLNVTDEKKRLPRSIDIYVNATDEKKRLF